MENEMLSIPRELAGEALLQLRTHIRCYNENGKNMTKCTLCAAIANGWESNPIHAPDCIITRLQVAMEDTTP